MGYTVIGVDLPGHGRSEHRPACVPYSAADYVLQLGHLVQEMGWPSVTLVGHSLGGVLLGRCRPRLPRPRRDVTPARAPQQVSALRWRARWRRACAAW